MKKIIVFSGFLVLIFSLHCSIDSPILEEENGEFPLSFGNWWKYSKENKMISHPPLSGDSSVYRDSILCKIIDRDEFIGYDSYVLKEWSYGNNSYTLRWYIDLWNGQPGLYEIGYERPRLSHLPKGSSEYKLKFAGREFTSPDEIIQWINGLRSLRGYATSRFPPRKVLLYPLIIGKEWVSLDDPFLLKRKVIDIEDVETPAGIFTSWKIEVKNNLGMEWCEWFSNEGLVKKSLWFSGEIIIMPGIVVGTFDCYEIYLLEDYSTR